MASQRDELCEATRQAIRQRQPGEGRAGQPANLPPAMPEDAPCGGTCKRTRGAREKEMRGNPEIHSARAEGSGIRGNSKLHRRYSGKMQDAGRLAGALGN